MAIIRWEPARELQSVQSEINRLFNTLFESPAPAGNGAARRWIPAMDLVENEQDFVLRADLPGIGEDGRQDRAAGRRPDDLRRAQGRAGGAQGGLLPRRALVGLVLPLADAAGGHRPRRDQGELRPRRARGPRPQARGPQAAQGEILGRPAVRDRRGGDPDRDANGRVAEAERPRASPSSMEVWRPRGRPLRLGSLTRPSTSCTGGSGS